MGIGAISIEKLDFKGIGEGVSSVFGGVGGLFKDIRTAITGKAPIDPNEAIKLEAKMLEVEALMTAAQNNINAIEAASPSKFIAGARPAAIWVCVFGLAYQCVLFPLMNWITLMFNPAFIPPNLDTATLVGLLFPLLGLGAYRTYEKTKGVQGSH